MSQNNEKKIPQSAEELNDYIHITTPSVWLILLAVGTFVAGLVIWSLTANLVTAVPAAAISNETGFHVYVSAENAEQVNAGNAVVINEEEYTVQSISDADVPASSVMNDYERSIISVKAEDMVKECKIDGTMPEGDYNAMVIVGMDRPISFLFRSNRK